MVQETGRPQIVKLDKALKLAERWVSNMSKVVEYEPMETTSEGRQHRLGLGAKVARRSTIAFDDPVARKLHSKIIAGKRKATNSLQSSAPSEGDKSDDDDDDDDELESRTRAFGKKKAVPPATSLPAKKIKK